MSDELRAAAERCRLRDAFFYSDVYDCIDDLTLLADAYLAEHPADVPNDSLVGCKIVAVGSKPTTASPLHGIVIWLLESMGVPVYRVFLRVSDDCWRETLPKRIFVRRAKAIEYAKQLAAERGHRLWEDAGFSVSTHRDGIEYWRAMCREYQPR